MGANGDLRVSDQHQNKPSGETLETHFATVTNAVLNGRLIPFLGAGVNLCGNPKAGNWQLGQRLPSGTELSELLAKKLGYPAADAQDLARVTQYIAVMSGSGPLYGELRSVFDCDYSPTTAHQFLAALPGLFRAKGLPPKFQLIVTTNYDDVLERAFRAANEPFDLVSYVAVGEDRGKFIHWTTKGEMRLIEKPNEYREVTAEQCTVIVKIHGAIDRANPDRDSFVITEDDYIDYLTRTDISNLLPITIAAKLRRSNFLFLGYGLRDWNLRVILHRIWGERRLTYKSWAIQVAPQPIDMELWRKRDVDILDLHMDDYLAQLGERLKQAVKSGGSV